MMVRIGLGLLLSLLLAGCHIWPVMSDADGRKPVAMGKQDQVLYPYAPPPVILSEDYGTAFRTARDNQILYPEASRNLEPVSNVDGPAIGKAIERYRKHFVKPPFEVKVKEKSGGK
ncbi:MAG: hypothetical protein ACPGYT_07955 [Nitrospirales bacterium]